MFIHFKLRIYTIKCPGASLGRIVRCAEKIPGFEETEWISADALTKDMHGRCIIIAGDQFIDEAIHFTRDTQIVMISDNHGTDLISRGFVDVLPPEAADTRIAAALSNMLARCDLKTRWDMRENLLAAFFDSSDHLLWTKDMADRHMDINQLLIDLAGKPRNEIEGRHEREVYGISSASDGCEDSDTIVRCSGKKSTFLETMPGSDGKLHHLKVTKSPWYDGQGRIIGTAGIATDMTEITNQHTKFERFIDALKAGILIVGDDGRAIQSNSIYRSMIGRTEEEIAGLTVEELNDGVLVKVPGTRSDYEEKNHRGRKKIWKCTRSPLKDYWGRDAGSAYMYENVTYEREQSRRIRHMAVNDQLTGLANRTGMYEYFDSLDKKRAATFMFIDVDNFKLINDMYGHGIGDQFLRNLAVILRKTLDPAYVARIGGDEIFVIMDGDVPVEDVERMAEELQVRVSGISIFPEDVSDTISLSIGILAHFSLDNSLDEVIKRCDAAMYNAKKSGKGKFYIEYDDVNLNS